MRETKKRVRVQEVVRVDQVTDGPAKGWIHTHGLAKFGKPELEIRGVPLFLGPACCDILNHIADYLINDDAVIKPGQRMQLGDRMFLSFQESKPDDERGYDTNHYTAPRLLIVDQELRCESCGRAEAKA